MGGTELVQQDRTRSIVSIVSVIGLVLASMAGCQWGEQQDRTPTTPRGSSSVLPQYSRMEDGSTVVDGQQINWYVSEWGSFPYEKWMYLEINQQAAVGRAPGEQQVPVTLQNVVLHFSELPAELTQIVIGVPVGPADKADAFDERGRFDVVNGRVSIPLAYQDLIATFGATHYSIWFRALGGENNAGRVCGQLALSGTMPGGQPVNLSTEVCFGTTPEPDSAPPTPEPGYTVVPSV